MTTRLAFKTTLATAVAALLCGVLQVAAIGSLASPSKATATSRAEQLPQLAVTASARSAGSEG